MIQLHSLAFGPFREAEPLNPRFVPGHAKLRVTVDTEPDPALSDDEVLSRLVEAFPGLARHRCQLGAGDGRENARGIVLLDGEPSANQAHLLEHLLLEILSLVEREPRLSGVTCAYESPPERNDVFVECAQGDLAGFLSLLAIQTLNAALAGEPIQPRFGDSVLVAGAVLRKGDGRAWTPGGLSRRIDLPLSRAGEALEILERLGLVEEESYAMNFSGEPHYRLTGASRATPSTMEAAT